MKFTTTTTAITIEFKSIEPYFRTEASGEKKNFATTVNMAEDDKIKVLITDIKYIRIVCTDGIQSFVRKITDITRYVHNSTIIYIFSW